MPRTPQLPLLTPNDVLDRHPPGRAKRDVQAHCWPARSCAPEDNVPRREGLSLLTTVNSGAQRTRVELTRGLLLRTRWSELCGRFGDPVLSLTQPCRSLTRDSALDDRCGESDLMHHPVLSSADRHRPRRAIRLSAGARWPSRQASSSLAFWAANSASVNVPLSRNVASFSNSSAGPAVPAV